MSSGARPAIAITATTTNSRNPPIYLSVQNLILRCHFHNFSQSQHDAIRGTPSARPLLSVEITTPVNHNPVVIPYRRPTNPTARAMHARTRPSRSHGPPPSLNSRCFCAATQSVLYRTHFVPTTRTQTRGSCILTSPTAPCRFPLISACAWRILLSPPRSRADVPSIQHEPACGHVRFPHTVCGQSPLRSSTTSPWPGDGVVYLTLRSTAAKARTPFRTRL